MQLVKFAVNMFALVSITAVVVPTINLVAATPTTSQGFHVEDRWNIGGDGGWGFLSIDPSAHRLFIPRTNRIMVIDTNTGRVVGSIGGMSSLRNMALDNSGKFGYATDVTDGTAGFVRVFDRSTLKLVASIPTGPVPFAIVFDPSTKLVFAFSSRAHNATVIDSATNRIVATIALGGRPSSAVSDGKGGVLVTLPAQGEIQRIDATSKTVSANWQLAPCSGPSALATDVEHHQVFTTCEDHKLVAIDTDTGHVTAIGNVPANAGDLGFDPHSHILFLADPEGSLLAFHRDSLLHFNKLQQIKTQPGARTMLVNQDKGKVYLVTAKFGLNSTTASEELHYRPTPIAGTFVVIVVGR
jgi:DNA-binding beta-propeller fold protein YncE